MGTFRIENNANYTVMSNYHLRDKNLSLRTIGLLSLILSLPEDWDYTQAGLASICKDGIDSVRAGLNELEKYGYLEKERVRDEKGRVRGTDYRIYEMPKDVRNTVQETKTYGPDEESPNLEIPKQEKPILENPILDKPKQAEPILEKTVQLSKDILNKDLLNTNKPSKDLQNTDITNLSTNQSKEMDGMMDGPTDTEKREVLKSIIRENVGYDFFKRKCQTLDEQLGNGEIDLFDYEMNTASYDLATLDQIIDYMLDILTSLNDDPIKIGDELISREMVKSKLHKVNLIKIKNVIYELNTNKTIKNPKKYAISMLYNA